MRPGLGSIFSIAVHEVEESMLSQSDVTRLDTSIALRVPVGWFVLLPDLQVVVGTFKVEE